MRYDSRSQLNNNPSSRQVRNNEYDDRAPESGRSRRGHKSSPPGRGRRRHDNIDKQNFLRDCPLVFMIIVTVMGLYISALILGLLGETKMKVSMDHPLFAAILLGEYNDDSEAATATDAPQIIDRSSGNKKDSETTEVSETASYGDATESDTAADDSGTGDEDKVSSEGDAVAEDNENPDATQTDAADTYKVGDKIPTEYIDVDKTPVSSVYYSNPGVRALTTAYPYIKVDKSYFDDALFIGDSRVEGMKIYSGLDNATFYCKEGLFMSDVLTENIGINPDGSRTTIPDALSKTQFKKIFIMIGINSIGIGNTDDYKNQYQAILAEIQRLQPQAIIFINSIMNVTTEKSMRDPVINNVNINDKNVAAAGFANGVDIFYIDVNDYVTADDRGLIPEYTWDGVHLMGQYYSLWVQCLEEHGVTEESFKYLE